MTALSSLYTALSGMNAQRQVMDVIGHNVANTSTPGYHRQNVNLQAVGDSVPGIFAGTETRNYGVKTAGITRSFDQLLEARAVREQAGKSAADLTSTTLDQMQSMLPEPSDNGIASQLDAFWGSWTDVANQPDGLAQRTQLLANASTLTDSLHQAASDITSLSDSAKTQMATLGVNANSLADQIASLNKAIMSNPAGMPDLVDQRDQALTQLAQLTGAEGRPSQNGQIDVTINGRAIVTGSQSYTIDGTGGTLHWVADGQAVGPPSGQAASLAATITDVVPRYMTALNNVAANLVTSVNSLHTVGYDQSGTTGRNFFDPAGTTAATINLSTDVAGQPQNVAAGAPVLPGPTAPGALDGDQAKAIAALAESTTGADSTYHALISGLAVEAGAASRRSDMQGQVADTAQQQADSVGGVSLDEEMANLTAAQRAYEASARVLTAVDDMLGYLIQNTGVVAN